MSIFYTAAAHDEALRRDRELKRLRAINADLLAALQTCYIHASFAPPDYPAEARSALNTVWETARAAIAKAKEEPK